LNQQLLNWTGKISAKIMRITAAFLLFFAIVSTVSAGRLRDVGKNKGYHPKLVERLRKKDTGNAKAKPQPVMERAAATTAAPTATSA
jgi:carboxypeptidase D